MKKPALARRLARQSSLTEAEAADRIDRVVNRIVARLRKGQAAPLPGLGQFVPGQAWRFEFEESDELP
ncbi:MAG: HU family DNA-binding protein [Bryobacterales bacterium]|nr:HU family DNA-binding protein [Bryobacterales bacterium]